MENIKSTQHLYIIAQNFYWIFSIPPPLLHLVHSFSCHFNHRAQNSSSLFPYDCEIYIYFILYGKSIVLHWIIHIYLECMLRSSDGKQKLKIQYKFPHIENHSREFQSRLISLPPNSAEQFKTINCFFILLKKKEENFWQNFKWKVMKSSHAL
jgi:hypothetical protein